MAALQNGTAFFASTSLFAIGGALTMLRSTDDVLNVVATLPVGIETSRMLWEIKIDRARGDLRLRVLQVRLVLPAVQLRGDPAWRDATRRAKRKSRKPKRM